MVACAVVTALMMLTFVSAAVGASTRAAAGTVEVQTVPALAGVRLSIGGVEVATGPDGAARVQVASINGIQHQVALTSRQVDSRTSVTLSRVSPQPHTSAHVSRLDIGLQVTSRVTVALDAGNSGVPAGDVTSLRLHSLAGQVLTIRPGPGKTVNLLSRRALLQQGVLTAQHVTWSVDHVATRDASALTTDSPRFDPFTHPVWEIRLRPVTGTLEVETIPQTPGVMVSVGGATLTTGTHGRGSTSVADLNAISTKVKLVTPEAKGSTVELLHVTRLPPPALAHRRLLIALKVSTPVTFKFVDPHGRVLLPGRVDEVRLDQGGHHVTIGRQELEDPVMLPSSLAHQVHEVWRTRRLPYSLTAVSVDGANAVFTGRQRFEPGAQRTWRVNLSVYDLSLTVRDSLLGRRVTSVVQVTFPDGKQRRVQVDDGGPTVLPSLVRGLYHLDVGAAVIGAGQNVLVSQNSSGDFRVITPLDLAIIGGAVILLVGCLVLAGRRLADRSSLHSAERIP